MKTEVMFVGVIVVTVLLLGLEAGVGEKEADRQIPSLSLQMLQSALLLRQSMSWALTCKCPRCNLTAASWTRYVRGYGQIREDVEGRCTMVEVIAARRNEAGEAPDEL